MVVPTAFAFDGFRWHLRAFCLESDSFKDYVLGRIYSVGGEQERPETPVDVEWECFVDLLIAANPAYSPPRRQAIERDYEMTNGETKVRTKRALRQYVERRLGLGKPDDVVSDHQIVLVRVEEVPPPENDF